MSVELNGSFSTTTLTNLRPDPQSLLGFAQSALVHSASVSGQREKIELYNIAFGISALTLSIVELVAMGSFVYFVFRLLLESEFLSLFSTATWEQSDLVNDSVQITASESETTNK